MKMYIAVLDTVPDYMTPTLVAHAVLGYHQMYGYSDMDNPHEYEVLYGTWYYTSFKKCVLRVNRKEFDKITGLDNVGLFYENTTLNGEHSCAVLVVDEDVPNVLNLLNCGSQKSSQQKYNTARKKIAQGKALVL